LAFPGSGGPRMGHGAVAAPGEMVLFGGSGPEDGPQRADNLALDDGTGKSSQRVCGPPVRRAREATSRQRP
jgi:hypothetical protein